jgi:hypothetical protein
MVVAAPRRAKDRADRADAVSGVVMRDESDQSFGEAVRAFGAEDNRGLF